MTFELALMLAVALIVWMTLLYDNRHHLHTWDAE